MLVSGRRDHLANGNWLEVVNCCVNIKRIEERLVTAIHQELVRRVAEKPGECSVGGRHSVGLASLVLSLLLSSRLG